AIVAAAPLSGPLDPAAVDQPSVFETIERRIQRRGMKGDRAVRPLLDQLADFVAVPLPFIEQREDQNFSAAPFQLALEQRRCHMWRDYIRSATQPACGGGIRAGDNEPAATQV